MSHTTEAGFYDVAMVEPGAPSMLPLDESAWLPLYIEAASWIRPEEHVVDLGCGTGRFGHALRNQEHYASYTGVDFSQAALTEARQYLTGNGYQEEDIDLLEQDLREWEPSAARAGNTVYVCLETLEHLADDRALVRQIPPGHRLIFSVPNYDSAAHLRTFRNTGDVWERYDSMLMFRRWTLIDLGGDRSKVHLCETVRRSDSW